MAKAVIIDKKTGYLGSVEAKSYPNASIAGEAHSAKITDIVHDAKVVGISYPIAKPTDLSYTAKALNIIPFYVRFTNTTNGFFFTSSLNLIVFPKPLFLNSLSPIKIRERLGLEL